MVISYNDFFYIKMPSLQMFCFLEARSIHKLSIRLSVSLLSAGISDAESCCSVR